MGNSAQVSWAVSKIVACMYIKISALRPYIDKNATTCKWAIDSGKFFVCDQNSLHLLKHFLDDRSRLRMFFSSHVNHRSVRHQHIRRSIFRQFHEIHGVLCRSLKWIQRSEILEFWNSKSTRDTTMRTTTAGLKKAVHDPIDSYSPGT